MKLVALKRLRYPRGPSGKEYAAGDTFEALSEKDARTLKLIRVAEEPSSKKPKAEKPVEPPPPVEEPPASLPNPAVAEPPLEEYEPEKEGDESEVVDPLSTENAALTQFKKRRSTYKRRDMKAED